jgi:hypothetical protein
LEQREEEEESEVGSAVVESAVVVRKPEPLASFQQG